MTETIPEGWENKYLKEIVKPVGKRSNGIILPYLEIGDININNKTYVLKQKGAVEGAKIVDKKTVLISRVRPTRGAITLVKEEKLLVSAALSSFDGVGIDNKFLLYCLSIKKFLKHMAKWETGSTYPSINERDIIRYNLNIPSDINEQEKIADILSKTDEQIQLTEEIIAKTEELKKGLMQELLTKGIGHTEFETVKYYGKTISFPKEWALTEIKKIGVVNTGITPPTSDKSNFGNKYMFATPSDLGDFKDIFVTKRYLSESGFNQGKKITKNSLLVVCIGSTIGKMGINKEICSSNQQINFIEFSDNNVEFIYYVFKLYDFIFKKYSGNVAVPIINKSTFEKLELPISKNKEEQDKIASILSSADKQVEDNKLELERLKEVKKGLMQDLLTGKVRVKV